MRELYWQHLGVLHRHFNFIFWINDKLKVLWISVVFREVVEVVVGAGI